MGERACLLRSRAQDLDAQVMTQPAHSSGQWSSHVRLLLLTDLSQDHTSWLMLFSVLPSYMEIFLAALVVKDFFGPFPVFCEFHVKMYF